MAQSTEQAVKKNKGGRPKKQDGLTPQQRKALRREQQRMAAASILRLTTEVEVPTALLLRRVATDNKVTVSKVVSDLVEAHLSPYGNTDPGLPFLQSADVENLALDGEGLSEGELVNDNRPRLSYVTRDVNPKQVDLELPATLHAFVKGCKGMSAGAVIETLVNARCFPTPVEFVGYLDNEGTVLTNKDVESRTLIYTHPCMEGVYVSGMHALTPKDEVYALAANKYARRHDAVLSHALARQANAFNARYVDERNLDILVEAMNKTASFISESVNERIRSRIRQQERRTNYADPVEGEVYENENGYVPRRRKSNDRKSNTGEGIYEDAR